MSLPYDKLYMFLGILCVVIGWYAWSQWTPSIDTDSTPLINKIDSTPLIDDTDSTSSIGQFGSACGQFKRGDFFIAYGYEAPPIDYDPTPSPVFNPDIPYGDNMSPDAIINNPDGTTITVGEWRALHPDVTLGEWRALQNGELSEPWAFVKKVHKFEETNEASPGWGVYVSESLKGQEAADADTIYDNPQCDRSIGPSVWTYNPFVHDKDTDTMIYSKDRDKICNLSPYRGSPPQDVIDVLPELCVSSGSVRNIGLLTIYPGMPQTFSGIQNLSETFRGRRLRLSHTARK